MGIDEVPLDLEGPFSAIQGPSGLDFLFKRLADGAQPEDETLACHVLGPASEKVQVHLEAGGGVQDVVEEDPLQRHAPFWC